MPESKDVFIFYKDYFKPLYTEIAARNNSVPVELLFEVHAAFDHLKRYYVDGEDEDESCKRAKSHLKRGTLDAFKLKLKYFHQDVEGLKKHGADLSLVDNGKFWPNLLADRDNIIKLAKDARLQEGSISLEQAFDKWEQVSLAINDFEKKYFSNTAAFSWAKDKTFSWKNKETVKTLIIGFISGCLSSLIISVLIC